MQSRELKTIQSKLRSSLTPFHYYKSNKQRQKLMNNLYALASLLSDLG